MSFYGPNAVLDDEQAHVYDYKHDRSELESTTPGVNPVSSSSAARNVPVQQMAELWQNQGGQLPPHPSMWMPPMMPPSSSNTSANPGAVPSFPMPPMMPPNMHPMGQGQLPPNMPPMAHPMGPPMPGMWGTPSPFGFQNSWGFPQMQNQGASQASTTQTQQPSVSEAAPSPDLNSTQTQVSSSSANMSNVPEANASNAGDEGERVHNATRGNAQVRDASPAVKTESTKPTRQPARQRPQNRQASSDQPDALEVPYKEEAPYSLTPKHNVTANSIAAARENPRQGGPFFNKRAFGNNSYNNTGSLNGNPNFYSEEYQQESEAIRPNRRFRHLMTDHDKRVVMDKCVKVIAQDDPFVDDFYFHIFARIHGTIGTSRAPMHRYKRVFNKGDGSTADKMRQQVQRAVDRAQEHRQKLQESGVAQTSQRKAAAGSRPRQALPALSQALAGGSSISSEESDRETTLRNIETVYDNLLALEAHAQRRPDPTSSNAAEWASQGPPLQEELWQSFLVQRPVDKSGRQPFVEMLLIPKGMKAFARSWPHFDPTRRLTVLTRLVVSIESLKIKSKNFELFGQVVVQPIVHLIGEADFETVILMADLAQSKTVVLAENKIGQLLLTAIVSRGEMLASSAGEEEMETSWSQAFAPIFDEIVPILDKLDVRDDQVWHFFAALALGSDLERQSELVEHVREQIFAQQALAKKLGGDAGARKIQALNLFLNVLGLNATLEDIDALKA